MMAPDEMSNEQLLGEHGKRLNAHDERLNLHGARIDGLQLVVMGDRDKRIDGLLDRTGKLEDLTEEIQQWRRDMMIYAKAGVSLLAVMGLGTWMPYIQAWLGLIGG